MFFWKLFFRKQFFQNFKNISAHKKICGMFFLNFFEKTFPKKNIFFSKKRTYLNCPFAKKVIFRFALQIQSVDRIPHDTLQSVRVSKMSAVVQKNQKLTQQMSRNKK